MSRTPVPFAPDTLESIRREIQALTRLRHPGVVRILDEGVDAGVPWYAMELLDGQTLAEYNWRAFERQQERYMDEMPTRVDTGEEPVSSQSSLRQGVKPRAAAGRLNAVLSAKALP